MRAGQRGTRAAPIIHTDMTARSMEEGTMATRHVGMVTTTITTTIMDPLRSLLRRIRMPSIPARCIPRFVNKGRGIVRFAGWRSNRWRRLRALKTLRRMPSTK